MTQLTEIFTIVFVCCGIFCFLAGAVALSRFPDALTRLHALTKVDNLGLGLIVLGLLPQAAGALAALKLCLVWLVIQLAGTTLSRLIAGAARTEKFGP